MKLQQLGSLYLSSIIQLCKYISHFLGGRNVDCCLSMFSWSSNHDVPGWWQYIRQAMPYRSEAICFISPIVQQNLCIFMCLLLMLLGKKFSVLQFQIPHFLLSLQRMVLCLPLIALIFLVFFVLLCMNILPYQDYKLLKISNCILITLPCFKSTFGIKFSPYT